MGLVQSTFFVPSAPILGPVEDNRKQLENKEQEDVAINSP